MLQVVSVPLVLPPYHFRWLALAWSAAPSHEIILGSDNIPFTFQRTHSQCYTWGFAIKNHCILFQNGIFLTQDILQTIGQVHTQTQPRWVSWSKAFSLASRTSVPVVPPVVSGSTRSLQGWRLTPTLAARAGAAETRQGFNDFRGWGLWLTHGFTASMGELTWPPALLSIPLSFWRFSPHG